MSMQKKALWLLVVAVLQGCASQYVLDSEEVRSQVKSAPKVRVIHYISLPMSMTTPNDTLPAGGGGRDAVRSVAGNAEGTAIWNRLDRRYRFPDPGPIIKARFIKGLRNEAGLDNLAPDGMPHFPYLRNGSTAPDEYVLAQYKKKYGNGLLMEIRMTGYQLHYLPEDLNRYSLSIQARTRLIRLDDSKIVWRGVCVAGGSGDRTLRFNMTGIRPKEARRLQAGIRRASGQCAEQLVGQYLGKEIVP